MESDRIGLKVLACSAAVVLVVEALRSTTMGASLGPHLAVIGLHVGLCGGQVPVSQKLLYGCYGYICTDQIIGKGVS